METRDTLASSTRKHPSAALVIDVRSQVEFDAGHYQTSVNIPLDVFEQKIHHLGLKDEQRPIVIVCQSGGRSSQAVHLLKKVGINAINGGSWRSL